MHQTQHKMHTYVNICFEIPDQSECDLMFKYLTEHPKDIWNYEDRVEYKFTQLFGKTFMLVRAQCLTILLFLCKMLK